MPFQAPWFVFSFSQISLLNILASCVPESPEVVGQYADGIPYYLVKSHFKYCTLQASPDLLSKIALKSITLNQ